jgi:FkbM family methyltransferase
MNLLQRMTGSRSPKLERPLKALTGYLLQGSGFSEWLQVRRSNYRIPFFCRSNVALTLWVNPDVIDRAEEFAFECLKPGDTLIDVGANIGCVTAAGALAVDESGRVLSIEAHPRTFAHLQKTVELNRFSNVTTLNIAVGLEPGTVSFTDERRKDDNNRVSLSGGSLQVPCHRLSDLVQQHGLSRIALLKIDVEGFEMQVLRGAAEILNRVECLYVEVLEHTLQRFGGSSAELFTFLQDQGFTCFRFINDPDNIVAFADAARAQRWQSELMPV